MGAALAIHVCAVLVLLILPRSRPPQSPGFRAVIRAAEGERLRYTVLRPAPAAPSLQRRHSSPPVRRAPVHGVPPAPPMLTAPTPTPVPAVAPASAAAPSLTTSGGTAVGEGQGAGGAGGGTGGGVGGGADAVPPKRGARIANNLLIGVDAPASVRPFQLKVVFEVDPLGRARVLSATHTRDGSYNRTLMAELAQIRFHPATRADGTAVTDTVPLEWDF